MQTVTVVVLSSVLVIAVVVGCSIALHNRITFPQTLRVQNDVPFTLMPGVWTRCPETEWLTPGDGVTYQDGIFFIEEKYSGALFTVNVEASDSVFVRFAAYGGERDFVQELGMIDMLGSTLWQAQPANDFYTIELMANEEVEVKMLRIAVQVNR